MDSAAKDFLSPTEFGHLKGLSIATVRRYLASGRLPYVQPGGPGCRVLIPRDALAVKAPAPPPAAPDQQGDQPPTRPVRLSGPEPWWRRGRAS